METRARNEMKDTHDPRRYMCDSLPPSFRNFMDGDCSNGGKSDASSVSESQKVKTVSFQALPFGREQDAFRHTGIFLSRKEFFPFLRRLA